MIQVIGGRLTLTESKLSTKNYQNIGLKELLVDLFPINSFLKVKLLSCNFKITQVNLEKKYSDVSRQLLNEKQVLHCLKKGFNYSINT